MTSFALGETRAKEVIIIPFLLLLFKPEPRIVIYIVTPSIPERVGRGAHYGTVQCTSTFHKLCYESHVIGGAVMPGTFPDSVLLLRHFQKTDKSPAIL
ncbi:hypothetical protein SFRURICE_011276 [Spodoptera frugiperda]|nr:hypothetical protein SFRURICE_011276 [Spodoptera frugiperda]